MSEKRTRRSSTAASTEKSTTAATTAATSPKKGRGRKKSKTDTTESEREKSTESTAGSTTESKSVRSEPDNPVPSPKVAKLISSEEKHLSDSIPNEILEKGRLYFFYRPKVDKHKVELLADVQRFYMLLAVFPESAIDGRIHYGDKPIYWRLIIIPRKRLPGPADREYGIVDIATDNLDDIDAVLGEQNYSTKTRGDRHVDPARPCGEALYSIVKKDPDASHVNLLYVLELPHSGEYGIAQSMFNIGKEASMIVMVRNPHIRTNREGVEAGTSRKAQYPDEIVHKYFAGKTKELRWIPLHPQLLHYKNAELLFIGDRGDLHKEWGNLLSELESEAFQEDLEAMKVLGENEPIRVIKELNLPEDTPIEPIATGKIV